MPEYQQNKPKPIQQMQKWAAEKELHYWEGFLLLRVSGLRKRGIYQDRQRSLAAVTQCLLNYLNLLTHECEVCFKKLAVECGLATTSYQGKNSYTRAIRLFTELLEPAGLVTTEKSIDPILNIPMPSRIFVTDEFFRMIGVTDLSYIEKYREKFYSYQVKRYFTKQEIENMGTLSVSEVRRRASIKHREAALASRSAAHANKMMSNRKNRLEQHESNTGKTYGYSKTEASMAIEVLGSLSEQEQNALTSATLRHHINAYKQRLRQHTVI